MKNLFAMLLLAALSIYAPKGFAQTPSDGSSGQRAVLTELPETVLNTELQLLGGKTLKLAEYSGKVIVINLFATWCGPCRFESPDLAKLHEEFKDRGLVVIELSTEDPEASKENVREWVWNFRLPYPVGWVTREVAVTLMQERGSIPQAFVIARDGRILKRFIGYSPTKTLSLMREAVEEALK
jgi:thiol-disulfide isomerase/thioredoxin